VNDRLESERARFRSFLAGRRLPGAPSAGGKSWSRPPPVNLYTYGSGWQVIRKQVLVRDGFMCRLRYVDICVGRASQVDHIVQPEAGGGSDLANLRAVCVPCHARRTGRQGALAKQRNAARRRKK
jgi:5-methylcytosine-specific restriction enzyme A